MVSLSRFVLRPDATTDGASDLTRVAFGGREACEHGRPRALPSAREPGRPRLPSRLPPRAFDETGLRLFAVEAALALARADPALDCPMVLLEPTSEKWLRMKTYIIIYNNKNLEI